MSVPTVKVPSWSITVLGPGGACVGDPAAVGAGGPGREECPGCAWGVGGGEGDGVGGAAPAKPVNPAQPIRTAPATTIAAFFSPMQQQPTRWARPVLCGFGQQRQEQATARDDGVGEVSKGLIHRAHDWESRIVVGDPQCLPYCMAR